MSQSAPEFPQQPSLPALQQYQKDICAFRGWDQATIYETFLLFSEEVGELAKAIRHQQALYVEKGKAYDPEELPGEFADVLSYMLELANQCGIDLTRAFREKEAKNATREWENGPNGDAATSG
jgi:NTP pyrophosphatase (non-canonical NTP hydrolase)